ncbi:hypothetical protein K7432_011152 [Basidiobolus ranarum]|uniref:GATA-type domain-containing protein n=1 Tax=Basidiobolus ranarum TaxID=34480 RepID=A0ABR2WMQ0_9FUNG
MNKYHYLNSKPSQMIPTDIRHWAISSGQQKSSLTATNVTLEAHNTRSSTNGDSKLAQGFESTIRTPRIESGFDDRLNLQQIQLQRIDSPMSKKSTTKAVSFLHELSDSSAWIYKSPEISLLGLKSPTSPLSSTDQTNANEAMGIPETRDNERMRRGCSNSKAKSARNLSCYNCGVTRTPLWRRTLDRKHCLCNACGLYFKQYRMHRPLHIHQKSPQFPAISENPSSISENTSASRSKLKSTKKTNNATHPNKSIICVNCSQTQTPLWRKNHNGEPICNACGLYAKLHNKKRPITLHNGETRRRKGRHFFQNQQYHEMLNFLGMNEEKFKQSLEQLSPDELIRWHRFFADRTLELKFLMREHNRTAS